MKSALIRAKHAQAAALMRERGLDCWLIQFAQETGLRPDPLGHLVGAAVTWPSAFLLFADGAGVAIVGRGDLTTFENLAIWEDVRGYVASPRQELLAVLDRAAPASIGISTSANGDHTADGLTLGMYRMLQQMLEGTPHRERLQPCGDLIADLRAVKLPEEIEGIRRAIAATQVLLRRIEAELLVAGQSEAGVQGRIHSWIESEGHGFAWERAADPLVSFGPRTGPLGHGLPTEKRLQAGEVIHVDVGLVVDGFASDLQRTWYLPRAGETEAPEPVQRTFAAVQAAMDAGFATLRPGVAGHEVDAAARSAVLAHGFPEPGFAFGHHVGQVAHDGGGVLGPRWERYGRAPEFLVAPGNVLAIEMDLEVPGGLGLVGLEEDVLVSDGGAEYLSEPQLELKILS